MAYSMWSESVEVLDHHRGCEDLRELRGTPLPVRLFYPRSQDHQVRRSIRWLRFASPTRLLQDRVLPRAKFSYMMMIAQLEYSDGIPRSYLSCWDAGQIAQFCSYCIMVRTS